MTSNLNVALLSTLSSVIASNLNVASNITASNACLYSGCNVSSGVSSGYFASSNFLGSITNFALGQSTIIIRDTYINSLGRIHFQGGNGVDLAFMSIADQGMYIANNLTVQANVVNSSALTVNGVSYLEGGVDVGYSSAMTSITSF